MKYGARGRLTSEKSGKRSGCVERKRKENADARDTSEWRLKIHN